MLSVVMLSVVMLRVVMMSVVVLSVVHTQASLWHIVTSDFALRQFAIYRECKSVVTLVFKMHLFKKYIFIFWSFQSDLFLPFLT
jgi:hypothetical protein